MTTKVESTLQVLTEANELLAAHAALILRVRSAQQIHRLELNSLSSPPSPLLKLPLIPSSPPSPSPEEDSPPVSPIQHALRQDLPPAKSARAMRYANYVPEEETIRNDYSQRYVDGGEWPQNWVLGAEPEHRFDEYPKQKRLLDLKKSSVNQHTLPSTYLPFSELTSLHPNKFDVILLDPPFNSTFTWDHLQELPIPSLASDPSFVFLWVGSGAGEGLERGREVLAKWGYRRCEDVVWIKTNKTTNRGPGTDPPTTSLFTRTKQHCLMGIRGTVRRSTDSWFVHCNVDTDVIIWEGDPSDPTRKPPETYTLIENFCLGLRRLEIFGKPSSLRRGWTTVLAPGQEDGLAYFPDGSGKVAIDPVEGTEDSDVDGSGGGAASHGIASRWTQETWEEAIKDLSASATSTTPMGLGLGVAPKAVVPMTPEIDALRPKSPVRAGHHQGAQSGGGGSGGGGGSSGGMGGHGHNHTPQGSMGGGMGMGMGMGMGGMGGGMGPTPPRFANMNRGGAGYGGVATNQMMGQTSMMVQPMMGMNGMGNMNMGMNPMGMSGMGMGNIGNMGNMGNMAGMGGMANMNNMNNVDEMMGNWGHPGMLGGLGGMNVNAMNAGMGVNANRGMGGMGGGMQGMGGVNVGMGQGVPMGMMNQMGQMGNMSGNMGMGNLNAFQVANMAGGGVGGNNGGTYQVNANWGASEQGQGQGQDDGGHGMAGMGMMGPGGVNQGMGMQNMGMGNMGMGGQQWGGSGNF